MTKKPFIMVEPTTGRVQSSKDVTFGAPKKSSKAQQALAELVSKSMVEEERTA